VMISSFTIRLLSTERIETLRTLLVPSGRSEPSFDQAGWSLESVRAVTEDQKPLAVGWSPAQTSELSQG
jgi:hypothetical protein